MMHIYRSLPALLLACAPAAAAQATLRPGAAEVAAGEIRESNETMELFAAASGEAVGRMSLRTVFARVDGKDAIVRTETTWIGGAVAHVDSFALDRRTLQPILLRSRSEGEEDVSLDFSPERIQGSLGAGPGASVDLSLEGPVFLARSMDLVLGALPLAPGYTARLATYDVERHLPRTARIRVVAEDDVRLPSGGRVPAWRVEVRMGDASGTYWVDRESRTLVQYLSPGGGMRLVRGGGAPGSRRDTR